jgi:hypothetical protein
MTLVIFFNDLYQPQKLCQQKIPILYRVKGGKGLPISAVRVCFFNFISFTGNVRDCSGFVIPTELFFLSLELGVKAPLHCSPVLVFFKQVFVRSAAKGSGSFPDGFVF